MELEREFCRFADFSKDRFPAAFHLPWRSRQRELLSAVEEIGQGNGRRFIRVQRGIGTTTILATAAIWLASGPRHPYVLFVSRTRSAACSAMQTFAGSSPTPDDNEWQIANRSGDLIGRIVVRGILDPFFGLSRYFGPHLMRPSAVVIDGWMHDADTQSSLQLARIRHAINCKIPSALGPNSGAILMASESWRVLPQWVTA